MPHRLRLGRAACAVAAALFAAFVMTGMPASGDVETAPPASPVPGAPAEQEGAGTPRRGGTPADATRPVVLVGIPGLRWDDVSPERTPALHRFAAHAALGSLSVRTTRSYTCPVEGWLTLSAGQRSRVDLSPLETQPGRSGGPRPSGVEEQPQPACASVPAPIGAGAAGAGAAGPRAAGAGAGSGPDAAVAEVPGWAEWVSTNAALDYGARPGTLGDALNGGRVCGTAVGAGAAVALARSDGTVARYLPSESRVPATAYAACPLTVVDLGEVAANQWTSTTPVPSREEQVRRLDARVGALLAEMPEGAVVMLAALADSSTRPQLEVAAARGGPFRDGWLETRSTRRVGLVQLTDLTSTLLALVGVPEPAAAVGSPITSTRADWPTREALDQLVDLNTAAQVTRDLIGSFFTILVASQLLLYGAAAVALRRRWGGAESRLRVLRGTRRVAIGFAAVPVSTYLANLVPWWRSSWPMPLLIATCAVAVLAVSSVALLGPWRRHLLGPFSAVAATTALVLGVDVATGGRLQLNSLMGYSPLIAGRFYGFGNIAFALFATCAILAVAGPAAALVDRGRRRAAAALAVGVGAVAVVLDGGPGSDFGGVIAIVPGFAVLAMGLAGVRVTPRRFAATLAGGVAAIAVMATLDWLRGPQDRSHLGLFVQQVLDGAAWTVVLRKMRANLGLLLDTQLALVVPFALAFLLLVLLRPLQWRPAALKRAYDRAETLPPALAAAAVTLLVGFAVNDSGIVIPAVGCMVAIPLALAASVTALERDELEGVPAPGGAGGEPTPEPEARGPAPTTA